MQVEHDLRRARAISHGGGFRAARQNDAHADEKPAAQPGRRPRDEFRNRRRFLAPGGQLTGCIGAEIQNENTVKMNIAGGHRIRLPTPVRGEGQRKVIVRGG
jgi:hypothetical protein